MESDTYTWGFNDYAELQCMVYRNREGIYVWNMSIDGMTLEEASAWAREYVCGWNAAREAAERRVIKRVSERPVAA